MDPRVEHKITECWQDGQSIGATRVAVKRCLGQTPAFDEVRRMFVALSHQYAGGSR